MSGADQSANLGGMLSQIGQTIGGGINSSGLTGNIKNIFRPGVDMNDPESLQRYAQWAGGVGNAEEALQYGRQAADMRENEKTLNMKKAALGIRNQYQQALASKDLVLANKVKEAAGKFSQETGVDAMSGLAQVDAQQRAMSAENRAQEAAQYAQQQRALAEADKQYRGQWLAASPEDKETLRTEMADKGLAGTVASLEAADRSLLAFQQSQEDRANAAIPLSTNELDVARSAIADMSSSGPGGAKMSASLEARLASIENDSVLTNRMKRQRVNELVNTAYNYSVGQASSADALARRLAAEKPSDNDLKSPSEWLTTAVETQLSDLKPGWTTPFKWLGITSTADEKTLTRTIEEGGADLVRRTAAYLTTYPQLTVKEAIGLVAKQTPDNPVQGAAGADTNVRNYDKDGNPI